MLTKKQNFLETIRGGNPDRFVKQFEAFALARGEDPVSKRFPRPAKGTQVVDAWGVTVQFAEHTPGPFPVHDQEHKVVRDITRWKEVVKAPSIDYPDGEWEAARTFGASINREEQYVTIFWAPGVFEQLHYLMGIDDCLMNFYLHPDEMKELIEYITDYELQYGELLIKNYQADAVFHHDDWGTHISSFMSPEMFREFLFPAYKKIYGHYRELGVEIIVHHSDSYAANLVPMMIELGIDVFQGCTTTNNVPELVKKFGGQISFMGDLNSGVLDVPDWTPELIKSEVRRACESNGKYYYIPCLTSGGTTSIYPEVYEVVNDTIDQISREMF